MIIQMDTAKNNVIEIKKILEHFSDKQEIRINLKDYIPYQGNAAYSGKFRGAINELASQACENKRIEISKIIQSGIFEILNDNFGILINKEREE